MGLAILGIIVAIAIPVLNPTAQIQKGYNAKREHDLLQIRNSLDAYYNDNNKYPLSFSFGTDFTGVGGTIYMKKVPKDPSCPSEGGCSDNYIYLTNPEDPQWFVLLAKLQGQTNTAVHCPYSCTGSLVPTPIPTSYNFCVFGGNIDTFSFCTLLAETPVPTVIVTPTPTPTPTQTPSITPTLAPTSTPTPTPILGTPIPTSAPTCPVGYYYCSCDASGSRFCGGPFARPQSSVIYYCDSECEIDGIRQCTGRCY